MITFHYPLLCHREYQLKQTKLLWCLWSISASWMFAGMLLRFLWMSSNVHFNFIWEASAHKVPSLTPNLMFGGRFLSQKLERGERWVAYWFWRAGSVIACAQKAVNQECSLLFAYTSRRLLCSSCANARVWNLAHYAHTDQCYVVE